MHTHFFVEADSTPELRRPAVPALSRALAQLSREIAVAIVTNWRRR